MRCRTRHTPSPLLAPLPLPGASSERGRRRALFPFTSPFCGGSSGTRHSPRVAPLLSVPFTRVSRAAEDAMTRLCPHASSACFAASAYSGTPLCTWHSLL
ncbi:hypothetical protein TRVL_10207 [Trypanosoma vivax]|nr:hypothetical protein TRVL_10207 [Trypanosoma vivax]